MKYYTMESWLNRCVTDRSDQYYNRLSEIRSAIPSDLMWLQKYSRLHDAKLKKISYDADMAQLDMELIGNGYDDDGDIICARHFDISYQQVVSFGLIVCPEGGFGAIEGFGDLGYDEVDLLETGAIEHRLLFSTGIEMQVVFRAFQLQWYDF